MQGRLSSERKVSLELSEYEFSEKFSLIPEPIGILDSTGFFTADHGPSSFEHPIRLVELTDLIRHIQILQR